MELSLVKENLDGLVTVHVHRVCPATNRVPMQLRGLEVHHNTPDSFLVSK